MKAGPYVFDGHKGISGLRLHRWCVARRADVRSGIRQDNGQAFSTDRAVRLQLRHRPGELPGDAGQPHHCPVRRLRPDGPEGLEQVRARGTRCSPGPPGGNLPARRDHRGQVQRAARHIYFTFGWNDSGGVLNCDNPELGFTGEDQPSTRGIKPSPTGSVPAQVTLHVDHIFWDTLAPRRDLRFASIQVAAWADRCQLGTQAQPTPLINTLDKLTGTLRRDLRRRHAAAGPCALPDGDQQLLRPVEPVQPGAGDAPSQRRPRRRRSRTWPTSWPSAPRRRCT